MTQRLRHQVELAGHTATLYITGALDAGYLDTLLEVCAALPAGVRTLRVDLHGLGQLDAESLGTIRQLLRSWRETRHGDFRLSTSYMIATLHEVRAPVRVPAAHWSGPPVNEALVATYL